MKFVCDKCQTRYSIGEDRVRGKILKIRCKNCGNVITVREGMDAGGAADGGGDMGGRKRPTTAAPTVGVANAKPAAPPPPPELDEEWYVSIDGVQSGPMSRPDAVKWIASKPFEADLHCWSEGFSDWMSVDKVSHFRNLRKPRAPERPKTIPPPIPKAEPPPKPLFASTMAALEKDATGPRAAIKPALPASTPGPTSKGTPAAPAVPRVNGGSVPPPGNGAGLAAVAPAPARHRTPSGRFQALKGVTGAALSDAFDPDPALDPPAKGFDFGGLTGAQPAIQEPKPAANPFSAFDKPEPAKAPVKPIMDDDDDLSIGEVSRVVKLADIAPKPSPSRAAAAATSQTGAVARVNATGSVQRISQTASQPRLSPAELGMNVDASLHATPDASMVAQSFKQRHRRGLIALIAFAGLLLAGVAGLLIYLQANQTDESGGGLGGGTRTIDTSRPEDIVRRQLPPETGSGSATQQKPKYTGTRPNNTTGGNTTPQVEDDPKGLSLKSSEIEDMAAKQGEGTKRCYMRAQKGALGFEIADVKKIEVTLTIGKDGVVSNVGLSSHANDSFGQCLIARVKSWKFRESPSGGTFRISLAFSNG